jgi:hypothetical protein
MRVLLPFLAVTLLAATGSVDAAAISEQQLKFFEEKVRPILSESCYKCHSVEAGKSKGGLTLDTVQGWKKGGDNGPAIVPGDVKGSLVLTAVRYEDSDTAMPPSSSGGKLPADKIKILEEWVKMGAPDPRTEPAKSGGKLSGLSEKARSHWAYQPVAKPQIPVNKNQQWCRTPVDTFILQKLEANTMLPSPDADRETLLRRVTYSLTGLPPTPQEIEAFVSDKSPQAFVAVVDRLLASPHYGERWARLWLNTARYSDTKGGDPDNQGIRDYRYSHAWTYRDYVIRSFNEDKPYDQFIREQVAADYLPESKRDPSLLAALGFLTVGQRFNNMNDVIDERIDTVTKGFLALTVSCARCHDHMFDPISQKDYYALHGVFASTQEPGENPVIRGTDPKMLEEFKKLQAGMLEEQVDRYYKQVQSYLATMSSRPTDYLKLAYLSGGRRREKDLLERQRLISEEKLDADFANFYGRIFRRGNRVFGPLFEFSEVKPGEFDGHGVSVLRGLSKEKGKYNSLVVKAFERATINSMEDVLGVYYRLFTEIAPQMTTYVQRYQSATGDVITGIDPDLDELLRGPFQMVTPSQMTVEWLRQSVSTWGNQLTGRARFNFAQFNTLELTHPGAPVRAMVLFDRPKAQNSPVFLRGQSETRGDVVPRQFLEILSPNRKPVPFKQGSGRFELAQAIADKRNPLTARVLVNRVWMQHFGEGFVRTLDDLGVMSEKPTHPELLDYLANYFMENNWSIKKLHRLILLSRVYQMSSHTIPDYETKDPDNRLVWRANVRRLDFESVRDSMLVMGGMIDRTMGGQPVNITDEPYTFRRSIYGFVDRGNVPELMSHFDFSDPDMPNTKRSTTIVPQQALFLMNSPFAVEVARRVVARPEVANAPSDHRRIFNVYRIMYQRTPSPTELALTSKFLQDETRKQAEVNALATEMAKRNADIQKKYADAQKALITSRDQRRAILNQGQVVERRVLSVWETWVQALLMANESVYVN